MEFDDESKKNVDHQHPSWLGPIQPIVTRKDTVLHKVIYFIQDTWPVRCYSIDDVKVRPFFSRSYCSSAMLPEAGAQANPRGTPKQQKTKAIARGTFFWPFSGGVLAAQALQNQRHTLNHNRGYALRDSGSVYI